MMDIISNNKLALAAAAIVIAGAVWYGFSGGSESPAVLGTENASGAVNNEDKEIVANLLKLRTVTLSGTILSSPVFLGLRDFSTEITQEPVGRADPFAPLPAVAPESAPSSGSSGAPFPKR